MDFPAARSALITYLYHKAEISDWHGVSDAANDLRVLEAGEEARRSCMCPQPSIASDPTNADTVRT